MRIALFSPCHSCGTTTLSTLLAYTLAYTQTFDTVLTYAGVSKDALAYTNTPIEEDPTRSITQVSKLLTANVISAEDLTDYSIEMLKNVRFFNTYETTITPQEAVRILSYIYGEIKADAVVLDIQRRMDDPLTTDLLKMSDIILTVVPPSFKELERLRNFLSSDVLQGKKGSVGLIVNRYDPIIAPLSAFASKAGFPMRATCKVHYNPWITQGVNKGTLDKVVPFILRKDPRIVALNQDLKEIVQFILSPSGVKPKWDLEVSGK